MSGSRHIDLYDTTLRDGCQAEDIAFTVEDKLRIAERLDDFGVRYIEGGWPGSNPRDEAFFAEAKRLRLKHARLAAFGSTRRVGVRASDDPNLRKLLQAETPVVTIFGKTWELHVRDDLRISKLQNLEVIHDSVAYLKRHVDKVIFDAEHFFDGFRDDPEFALECCRAAADAGADLVCLCDTNGGRLPEEVAAAIGRGAASGDLRHRHSLPQRLGTGGGQQPRGGPARRVAGAGHHQRDRRALRQRQSLFGRRQPAAQDGLQGGDGRAAAAAAGTVALRLGAGQCWNRTSARPSSA